MRIGMLALITSSLLSLMLLTLGYESISFYINVINSIIMLLLTKEKNIIHQMYGIGYILFIFFPYIIYYYVSFVAHDYYLVLFLFSLFFIYFTKEVEVEKNTIPFYGCLRYLIIVVISIISLVLSNGISFIFFSGILFLFMMRGMENFDLKDLYIYLVPYFVFFSIFFVFFWSGFGRLVLAGNIIFPILYWLKFSKFNFKNILLFLSTLFIGCLMSLLRFKDEDFSLDLLLKDSSLGPFFLGQDIFLNRNSYNFSLEQFLEQVLLFFFTFVPRIFWESKPIGFGRLYVDQQMNTYLYSDEHSIAGLMIGDFFYFLGNYAFFGIVLFLVFIIYFYKVLNGKFPYINHVALIYLPTLIWGGMASFGARFSLVAIFIILWILCEKIVNKSIRG